MTLIYLMDEICAGVEIYYSGRQGGQYLKTGFILCDDYTELTSKLFLITKNAGWLDRKPDGRFKNYHDIQQDIRDFIRNTRPADSTQILALSTLMETRRNRRNDFFHSTTLLDLSVTQRICVEAFCDLLDYGLLLFGSEWIAAVSTCRNLGTLEILLRLEKKSFNDPSILAKMNRIFARIPRNGASLPKNGAQITYPFEDLYYRMCVISGGKELKTALATLL